MGIKFVIRGRHQKSSAAGFARSDYPSLWVIIQEPVEIDLNVESFSLNKMTATSNTLEVA